VAPGASLAGADGVIGGVMAVDDDYLFPLQAHQLHSFLEIALALFLIMSIKPLSFCKNWFSTLSA
jgi:hypothetical protein